MDKKKAIKLLSATAVAATAFVATTPASADAATQAQAQDLVNKAKNAGTVLKWAISVEGSADGKTRPWKAYNDAKAARDAAVAAVNTLPAAQKTALLADLDENVNLHITRAMHYIDAITAGEKIKAKQDALANQIAKGAIDDTTEAAYHELSKEIRKQAVLLDRVYGKSTRDAIRGQYKQAAEQVRDSVKYAVTVKMELDLLDKAIAANDTAAIEKHITEVEKYMNDVEVPAMKTALEAKKDQLEGQLTPAVQSVTAVDAKTIKISFSKAVKENSLINADGTLEDGVVTITAMDGANAVDADASKASLSKDGKVLTITADTYFDGQYAITVTKDVKATDDVAFEAFSGIFTNVDEVRPTVASVTYPYNGTATVTFSEALNVADAAAVEAALTIKDEKGNAVSTSGLVELANDKKSFNLNISGFTVDKKYSVSIVGLKDYADNLISPNPVSFEVINKTIDEVAPQVTKLETTKLGQLIVTFSEKVKADTDGVIGQFKVDNGSPVDIDITSGNATVDETGKVVTITDLGLPQTAGVHTVEISGYKDLSGNAGEAFSRVLQFKADTVAPSYVSHEIKTISGVQYLIVKFSEDVTGVDTATEIVGTYVDENKVTNSVSIVDDAVSLYDVDGDGVSDSIKIPLTGNNPGTYNVTLPAGLATDGTNTSEAKAISFVLGSVNDEIKPAIVDSNGVAAGFGTGIVVQTTEDKLTITFTEPVSAETALNTNNYKVEGQNVFTNAIFKGSQSVVELTLKANVITLDGLRNFTVANIADVAGNVMDTVNTQLNFYENVKPTIEGARLTTSTTIDVTFSEAMTEGTLTDNNDFKVYVGGEEVTVNSVAKVSDKVYTLTLNSAVTDLSKVIEVEVLADNDAKDAATTPNSLSTTGKIRVSVNN